MNPRKWRIQNHSLKPQHAEALIEGYGAANKPNQADQREPNAQGVFVEE